MRRIRRLGLGEGRLQFLYGVTIGYVGSPGDVAVQGPALGADSSAACVAIVTDDSPGQLGPDVVNGKGTRPACPSSRPDRARVDYGQGVFALAGYVSRNSSGS